jgi:hypothetical protein
MLFAWECIKLMDKINFLSVAQMDERCGCVELVEYFLLVWIKSYSL